MEIRTITKEERPLVQRLHQYAYGFWSDQDPPEAELDFMIPDETYGVFEKGQLVTTTSVLNLHQWIRGVRKGMGGISMVASYPEARRKGYVRSIMLHVFTEMRKQGLSVTMLEPFRESFYAKFGYVPANSRLTLKAPLQALRSPTDKQLGSGWTFERHKASEVKDAYVDFVLDHATSQFNGFAIRPKFSDVEWTRRNKNCLMVLVKHNGQVEALARYRIKGYMHFEEPGKMLVIEMHWRSLAAQAALFNYFSKHQDQVTEITLRIPYGTDFQPWFIDLPNNVELKSWNPWMVRIIDAEAALTYLPVTGSGKVTLGVSDPHCKWNDGIVGLQAKDQRLKVNGSRKAPDAQLTIEGLSALLYGTHSLEALEYLGWVTKLTKSARTTLANWFPAQYLYNPLNF
ncbi:MAG: enhanced intracellular survival protein Eis [Promethearchaeota archaeon]